MVEFEGTIFQGSAADVSGLMAKMGPSAELVVSVLGSSAGTRLQNLIAPDSGTATIIAAGRGAETFRKGYSNVFKNIPNAFISFIIRSLFKTCLVSSYSSSMVKKLFTIFNFFTTSNNWLHHYFSNLN